ncbi:scavenger receptor cysteine-rich type 1 protein M130-like isoform X3 [Tachysurus fulvidraco]|uniref:scavenger receptor cysteine-rich type 1 protein M130-like isoform X3 n=1 Tax=Tachysurus fulvidraco TaxID=1234273 RepID=UPI001FEFEB95|nr:scavenger receptor cysteine-rich type 1 protein M130-like isoform X3 [Tachysurus fulvidraco]
MRFIVEKKAAVNVVSIKLIYILRTRMMNLHLTLTLVGVLRASLLADGANIRLTSGYNSCSGRVEILHNGQWGTVCDDDWDLNDAEVVCRQIGCGKAVTAHPSAHFGQGSGEIWLNDVQCSGNESTITQCSHRGFRKHICSHREDAGVTCSAFLAPYIGIGVTAGLLLILVPVIICFVKTQKIRRFQSDKKSDSQRAKKTYECHQEEAETIFYQKDDSEDSDNDYINVEAEERSDADDDYINVDAEEQRHDSEDSDNDYINVEAEQRSATDDDYINVDAEEQRHDVDNYYEDAEMYAISVE